ncbi:MAG: ATP-binding protein [Spirochaetales bacterium]|nr:ATP-binding protein [Spirochaetales bacterium]
MDRRRLLNKILLPAFSFYINDNCSEINEFGKRITGSAEEDLNTLTFSTLFDSPEYGSIDEISVILDKYKELVFEAGLKTKQGNIIPVKLQAINTSDKEGKKEILLLGQETGKEILLEEEIKKLIVKAEESDRLKLEFLNNISHEIRTPMSGIIGFADLLKNQDLSAETRIKHIEIINQSAHRLMSIVDNILEISTLEVNQAERTINEEVNAGFILRELYKNYNHRFRENKIDFLISETETPEKIDFFTDRDKLYKILNNLVDNSLKFTHAGSVKIGCYTEDKLLIFYVKDTGIGIDPQNSKLIFKSFSQEDKSFARKYGGLGLGLTIAEKYAALLGGEITFVSEKEKGSIFKCTIPYKSGIKITPDRKNNMEVLKEQENTILIAEDEGINYLYLQSILNKSKTPITIIHARNGQEAIDMVLQNSSINLVLMDLKMPVMNGFEATEKIKSIRPDLPIVAQSAYSTSKDMDLAKSNGCDDYLVKPVKEIQLKAIIKKYIGELK